MAAGPVGPLNEYGLVLEKLMANHHLLGPAHLAGRLRAAGYKRDHEEIIAGMEGRQYVDARLPGEIAKVLNLSKNEMNQLAWAVAYGQRRARP